MVNNQIPVKSNLNLNPNDKGVIWPDQWDASTQDLDPFADHTQSVCRSSIEQVPQSQPLLLFGSFYESPQSPSSPNYPIVTVPLNHQPQSAHNQIEQLTTELGILCFDS